MSLNSGERQVTPNISEIRADHTARYRFAASIIPKNSRVIDAACGIGYGSKILAEAGHTIRAFDIDSTTLQYADNHYAHDNISYRHADFNYHFAHVESDVAVSFETIEHIRDPRNLLKSLRAAKVLIVSVPNEDVMPWRREDGSITAFHFRHYTKAQFETLLHSCGWFVREWYGQKGAESDVELDVNGRTLIAVCDRTHLPPEGGLLDSWFSDLPEHAPIPDQIPEAPTSRHIAILGLGPSLDQFTDQVKRAGGRSAFCDEVWAINALGDLFACDLVFHMDDIRIQLIRAEARPDSNIAAMTRWIKNSKVPVVTSRTHPDYPTLVEYPLEEVLNHLGHDYFNNTAAYAVALAIHIGATKISCFGMDYSMPNVHHAEKGRACVEFWLGQAHARGIEIGLPTSSTLMDSRCGKAARLYGYDCVDIDFNVQEDGHLALSFKERDTLPTAEEVEANYDHSKPIAEQHKSFKEKTDA